MTNEQMQMQMHEVLVRNVGSRLTPELINGLTARLHQIALECMQARAIAESDQHTEAGT